RGSGHVVGNEDDEDWYEACNPITGARGYVPVTYFQILEKTGGGGAGNGGGRQRNSNQSLDDSGNDSGSFTEPMPQHYHSQPLPYQHGNHQHPPQHSHALSNGSGLASPALSQKSLSSPSLPKCQPLYGIVLYDFGAERTDELDCKVGDAILVIAQSNEEWYVAKPIGRLGGPGLIPVSFVEIRDMVTGKPINVPEMLRQTGTMIPRVEEWKKQAQDYKANSIPLGRIDAEISLKILTLAVVCNDTYEGSATNGTEPFRIVHASVESFHHEDDQYWFTVRVEMATGATRNLFRLYEDFYNFHIALLEEFPVESGRVGDQPRILPFMPIPLQNVTDMVSASRRTDLDGYVQDLCKLPARITQHPLVEQLFAVRDGDTETFGQGPAIAATGGLGIAPGPVSPGQSRSPLPNSVRESERRPSIPGATGPRAVFGPRSQGQRSYGDDSPSGGASPSLRSQAQFGSPTPGQGGASEEMIKVKISYQEDIMAMRIPVSISFKSLQQKIFERLHADPATLSFRDDRGDFAPIQTDVDVREAIDRSGGKLMIYVD
ncbi:bud emergence protein 1, partial [Mortierella alpina]